MASTQQQLVSVVGGGELLERIHNAACAVATRWSGRRCVVASVGNFHLDRPIDVGEPVDIHAELVYTGRSSMHILVTVASYLPNQISQCPIIFVAVDELGTVCEVPPWTPVTMLELQRQRQARVRIRMRKRIEDVIAAGGPTAGSAPGIAMRLRATADDAHRDGRAEGGRVLRWIDDAACACGADWTGAQVITSYIAGIRCYQPVFVDELIEVSAQIIHTGPRSVHTAIRVTATDTGGRECLVAEGLTVVVSLDDRGMARAVPQWEPESHEDRRFDQYARQLIELRQFAEPFTAATVA